MSLTREFLFENSNGIRYRVRINRANGAGLARKITGTNSRGDGPRVNGGGVTIAPVSFTVDVAQRPLLATADVSRLCFAPIYNTAQALNAVLNAAS